MAESNITPDHPVTGGKHPPSNMSPDQQIPTHPETSKRGLSQEDIAKLVKLQPLTGSKHASATPSNGSDGDNSDSSNDFFSPRKESKEKSTPNPKSEKRKAADRKYKPKKQLDQILQALQRGIDKFREKKVRAWSGVTFSGNEAAVAAHRALCSVREHIDLDDKDFDKYHSKCAEIVEDVKNTGDYEHATDLLLKLQTTNPFETTLKSTKRKAAPTPTPSSTRPKRAAASQKSVINISDEEEKGESIEPTPSKKPKLASKGSEEKKKKILKRLDILLDRFADDVKDLVDEMME